MHSIARHAVTIVALATFAFASQARAIVIGTLDNFQDFSTQSWGGASPVNIPSGGPAGGGDAYLQSTSAGGAGPGSRLAVDNLDARWAGNYLAAGVTSLEVDFANFSHSTLEMRAVFFSVTGARWTSANAQIIPADGGAWHHLAFGLGPADLVLVAGTDTYTQCMSNVTRLMFRHDAGTPSSGGTAIVAVGGFDNVLAAPAPGGVALLALAGLGTGRRRR